jgi:hypothetical protein
VTRPCGTSRLDRAVACCAPLEWRVFTTNHPACGDADEDDTGDQCGVEHDEWVTAVAVER